jgi:hypothetical protein
MKLVLVEFYPLNECRTEIIPPEKYYFSRLFCGLVGEKEAAARYKRVPSVNEGREDDQFR